MQDFSRLPSSEFEWTNRMPVVRAVLSTLVVLTFVPKRAYSQINPPGAQTLLSETSCTAPAVARWTA
jgi:hypothetical protein